MREIDSKLQKNDHCINFSKQGLINVHQTINLTLTNYLLFCS